MKHTPAGPPTPAKGAEIVEAHDVIGVRMGENNRIEPPNILPQRLGPKVGPGIDYPRGFGRFHIDGRAQTLIARVG